VKVKVTYWTWVNSSKLWNFEYWYGSRLHIVYTSRQVPL
jgi:hypothetical protein